MQRIKLIHWKSEEIEEKTAVLEAAGYQVDSILEAGSKIFQQLGDNPPDAVVIDLSHLPSQGRDFALMIRKRKGSRHIPIVFVAGVQVKVAAIKKLLPDARYTTWDEIGSTLEKVIAKPPEPVVHESTFAGYAGKPLSEKLGIRTNMTITLVNPTRNFTQTLGKTPDGVTFQLEKNETCDSTIWFSQTREVLESNIHHIIAQAMYGPVWIAWPKKKSGIKSDLTQQFVRQMGLQTTWLIIKFVRLTKPGQVYYSNIGKKLSFIKRQSGS